MSASAWRAATRPHSGSLGSVNHASEAVVREPASTTSGKQVGEGLWMVWLRPLKPMTRLFELVVTSERPRCVEYLGALPFPGRTREGDERRVPMELAGEWVEGCPWICPPLRSVCRPVCNLVARPPRMLRSAAHSRHIVHPPPPRVSRPCPPVLLPPCIAALRAACPRNGPQR